MKQLQPALELRHISKTFGGVRALRDVSLDFYAGEIHGLLGHNGAGKSTLIKILDGYHDPDSGAEIRLWDRGLHSMSRRGRALPLGVVHQELPFVDDLTVIENLGVGTHFSRRRGRLINWRREAREAAELLREFGLDVSPTSKVGALPPAERAILNIIRAIRGLRESSAEKFVLLLDEPTSYLSQNDSQRVISLARQLASRGCAIIIVTHRISEALDWCDRITVLRDGRVVDTVATADGLTEETIETMMFGGLASVAVARSVRPRNDAPPVLEVDGLTGSVLTEVSFDVRPGEVLGFAGLVGMGQDELPHLLFGAASPKAGRMLLNGQDWHPTPARSIDHGVVLVPGNRQRDSLWAEGTVTENVTLTSLRQVSRGPLLNRRAENAMARRLLGEFQVRPLTPLRQVMTLSGGNQQKVVLGRLLSGLPRVILLHEPTQGVDASASRTILNLAVAKAKDGAAVIVCSSDAGDLAAVCDSVKIVSQGRVVSTLEGDQVSEEAITLACHRAQSVLDIQREPAAQ